MMSARRGRFFVLLLATAAVVAAAAWLSTRRQVSSETESGVWLPDLRADLDRITALHLTGAGDKRLVTLERDPDGFVVVERDRYPADTVVLRTLLLQVAEARRLEAKTARADLHAALGVESVADAKATGVRIDVVGASRPVSVTIGRTAAQLGGGTFVRSGAETQAWLVSGDIVVEREAQRWLEKRIAHIPATRIERIDVRAADGDFALVRPAPGPASGAARSTDGEGTDAVDADVQPPVDSSADGFVIEGVPAAQMATPFAAAATAGALAELDLLDVSRRESASAPARGTTVLRFALRNGVSVQATVWEKGGTTRLQLEAAATVAPAQATDGAREDTAAIEPSAADSLPTSGESTASEASAKVRSNAKAVAAAVQAFNKQWSGWTYVLPPHRRAGMMPTRSALLEAPNGS